MDAIGMMTSGHVNLPVTQKSPRNQVDKLAIFQGLMMNEQAAIDTQGQKDTEVEQPNREGLLTILQNLPGMADQFADMFLESGEDKSDTLEALDQLEDLLATHVGEQGENESVEGDPGLMNVQLQPEIFNESSVQQQLATIFKQAKEILGQVENGHDVPKAVASLVKLLEQWTTLAKKLPDDQGALETLVSGKNKDATKEQALWRELVQSFQKRNQFVTNQQYNSDAKVTGNDVAKWLQKALNDQTHVDKASPQQQPTSTAMPMSKVEQYVLYINQNQGSQSVDQQLIDQFQQVMKSSKFLAMNNGASQLSISLKPDNLGEMMVKLTQINGEVMVKILVSSQATKDMLESNMHQLKNMFSPQQVVIEKHEMNAAQTQNFQGKQGDQTMHDSNQEQSHHQGRNDETNQQASDDFQAKFHELLLNEKV